jgi:hypothetical protein
MIVGDLVLVPIKNRWDLNCTGEIQEIHEDTVDVLVYNMGGPGDNKVVTGIPFSQIKILEDGDPEIDEITRDMARASLQKGRKL